MEEEKKTNTEVKKSSPRKTKTTGTSKTTGTTKSGAKKTTTTKPATTRKKTPTKKVEPVENKEAEVKEVVPVVVPEVSETKALVAEKEPEVVVVNEKAPEVTEAKIEESPKEEVTEEKAEPKKGLGAQPTKIETEKEKPIQIQLSGLEPVEDIEAYVEGKRKPFYSYLFKTRLVSYIIIGSVLAIVIALFIILFVKHPESQNDIFNIITYVLLGIVIAGVIANLVYSRMITKKQTVVMNQYIIDIVGQIHATCFGPGVGLDDAVVYPNVKIDVQDVINAHLYTIINRVESRSYLTATLNGVTLRSADIAAVVPNTIVKLSSNVPLRGQESYAIYGRFFAYDKPLASKEALIICRNENNCVLPDHLNRYQTVEVPSLNSAFTVYATSEEVCHQVLTEEIVSKLNEFTVEAPLLNYIISWNECGLYVATTYNDDYMAYPVNKPVKEKVYSSVANDTKKILDIIKSL
ncbi:MAG TPA: hypothetical protein DCY93_00385 [Firmicutes bacterium]|nr:hypothetical protein [Bacillota bacterium]